MLKPLGEMLVDPTPSNLHIKTYRQTVHYHVSSAAVRDAAVEVHVCAAVVAMVCN